jgi:hypothetical protein
VRYRRRARQPGLGAGLLMGLGAWAGGTAAVVGLDLDPALAAYLPLGPGRAAALAGTAHLLLAVPSLLRLGTSGLAVVLARVVLHGLMALGTATALVLVAGFAVGSALARATWDGPLLLLAQIVGAALALAPLETAPVPRQRHPMARRSGTARATQYRAGSAALRPAPTPVPPVSNPPATPAAGTPSPPATPSLVETRDLVMHVNGAPERVSDTDQGPRREAPPTPAGEEPVASRAEAPLPPPSEVGEPMIRIPFERVAGQLPAEAFRLPLDRVDANLLEPGYLLVPQKLLVPQLAEGQAHVAWDVVAEQFPPQVLAWEHAAIAGRLPGGALGLPLDEVVRQLPPDLLTVPGTTPDMRALEDFPLPFQPHVPPPTEQRESGPAEPEPAVLESAAPETAAEPEPPADEGVAHPELAAEPVDLTGALGLAGARQLRAHRLDGWRIVTLTGPDVVPEEAARLTADLAALLDDPRLPALACQLTVRGPRGTLVVTPIDVPSAGGPILAATAEPTTALAQLERAALRMSRLVSGDRRRPVDDAPSDLVEAPVPPAVRDAAERLRAFGPLTPAVLHDGGLTVYLFLAPGTPPRPIAGWARDLRAAVRGGWLATLESAVVRLGEDRLLLREVEAGRGAAALLVAGGAPVSRPGLARLEVERAVARLGAH